MRTSFFPLVKSSVFPVFPSEKRFFHCKKIINPESVKVVNNSFQRGNLFFTRLKAFFPLGKLVFYVFSPSGNLHFPNEKRVNLSSGNHGNKKPAEGNRGFLYIIYRRITFCYPGSHRNSPSTVCHIDLSAYQSMLPRRFCSLALLVVRLQQGELRASGR